MPCNECVIQILKHTSSAQVDGARPEQLRQRPSLINYNPVANPGAVVTSSDNMARFTMLTPRLIRMEYSKTAGQFEDHSTIAMMNRNLPVPQFTHAEVSPRACLRCTNTHRRYLFLCRTAEY
jgi:hypothetical protein